MIEEWNLPTKPSTKHRDSPNTVELEALPPDDLRNLVREIIEQHTDDRRIRVLEACRPAPLEGSAPPHSRSEGRLRTFGWRAMGRRGEASPFGQ